MSFAPLGWPTITPRIVCERPDALVAFVKHVFGATGEYRTDRPTVLNLGGSTLMISNAPNREQMAAFLYVYVENVDETCRRAVEAGCHAVEEATNLAYGDRRAMVKDEWGNLWQIATHLISPTSADDDGVTRV